VEEIIQALNRYSLRPLYRGLFKTIVFALVLAALSVVYAAPGKPLATFENGSLYAVGSYKVLELNGGYRQMGRQYGKLMSGELTGMYLEVLKQYDSNKIINAQPMADFSSELFRLYPYRYLELAEGMAETSGWNMRQIATLNEFFDTTITAGDPTPEDESIYQFVTIPAKQLVWLKACSYSDWTQIDLKDYFKQN